MDIRKAFGKVLKEVRLKSGISQMELAEISGFDRTYISILERGLQVPSLNTVFVLAEALEVSPTYLVKEVEKLN